MKAIPDFYDKQEITVKNKGGREIKAIVYIMTKDYMQNFNPPGQSYLTGILKGCRQNQIPTEPILKAARKPPVPGTDTEEPAKETEESRTGTMKNPRQEPRGFFKTVCLAAFLKCRVSDLPYGISPNGEQKLVAELKGNFPEPGSSRASDSEKKDQPAGRKCPVAAVDLVSLQEQYPDVQGWLTIPDTGIDYPVLQSNRRMGSLPETELQKGI